jgi:hypothetical protein
MGQSKQTQQVRNLNYARELICIFVIQLNATKPAYLVNPLGQQLKHCELQMCTHALLMC